MEQANKPAASAAMQGVQRLGRMVVFCLSAGFLYPNVWIEGMDLSAIQGETEGELYKSKKK
ncbi:MAG: hypothetical protein ACREUW_02300 [Burkholderiales bacterium]